MTNILVVNKIFLIANYNFNKSDDICSICRENINDKCIKCNINYNKCHSVLGECNHAYHLCCINNWKNSNTNISNNCPLCNKKWIIKKNENFL